METVIKKKTTPKKTLNSERRPAATKKKTEPVVIHVPTACKTCRALPVGSVELTSLLLVLIFSLVSVLFTSILALKAQDQKISHLEAQVVASQMN